MTLPDERTETVPTTIGSSTLATPTLIEASGADAIRRFIEFFTVTIRNPNTRAAYGRAALNFCDWCAAMGLEKLGRIEPVHVGAYVELLTQKRTPATVKQHLAALRMLFGWLVSGQVREHAILWGVSSAVTSGGDIKLRDEVFCKAATGRL